MELVIVLACGLFFLLTAIVAYVRQMKDFENDLKSQKL